MKRTKKPRGTPMHALLANGINRCMFEQRPSCPIDHGAAPTSPEWGTWKLLGVQQCPADETGPAENLELRNCPVCNTTVSKELVTA